MGTWAERCASERAKYAGRVVAIDSYYHDGLNDYSVMLWNPETLEVEHGPGYMDSCPLVVDGPAWVVALYTIAKAEEVRIARERRMAEAEARAAEEEARVPRRGRTVRVVRGRKIPKGTVAEVFWFGETRYGWRVGLEVDGERVFTDARNVEVVGTEEAA